MRFELEPRKSSLQFFVKLISSIVLIIGVLVMMGWYLDLPLVRDVLEGAATMKFNTALCFFLSSIALWLMHDEYSAPRQIRIGKILSGVVIFIGVVSLAEYILEWNLGIDQLFVNDLQTPIVAFPGRMSAATAICFVILGLALFSIDTQISQNFSLLCIILSLLATMGYIFDYNLLYQLLGFETMAVHTAVGFLILAVATLFTQTSYGLMRVLTSPMIGSKLAGLLLPVTLILMISLGWAYSNPAYFGLEHGSTDTVWFTLIGLLLISPVLLLFAKRINLAEKEILNAYDATIEGWSRALDFRDKETEGHSTRVAELTLKLARAAGFSEDDLVHVRRGALLHDIGKMGLPDHILLKPDKLTEEEWEIVRRHPTMGYEMLSPIKYLKPALEITYCHHEKWDGTGYPRGLSGKEIPLSARLFAIVDVWDALRSDRPYRKGWSDEKTLDHIMALSGTHFDPDVVELFFEVLNQEYEQGSWFLRIQEEVPTQ